MTLKEIAEEAGVSAMTVSNVINHNDTKVSEETRKRVQAIIDKYRYVPNMSARSLSARNSRIIALLLPVDVTKEQVEEVAKTDPLRAAIMKNTLSDYYVSVMVGYLESKLKDLGYYIMLRSFFHADEILELQRHWQVDGCIMLLPKIEDEENRKILAQSRCPVVIIDRNYPDLKMLSVGVNDYRGGYLATQECMRYGHRRIAFVSTVEPERVTLSTVIHSRYQGYLAALRDAGIPEKDSQLLGFSSTLLDGRHCGEYILSLSPEERPTALVVASDTIAIGAIAAMKEGGLRVPEDISVVGYDDLPMSSLVDPALTTISQDLDAKASAAGALLKMAIDDPQMEGEHITIDVKLVERGTVTWAPGYHAGS